MFFLHSPFCSMYFSAFCYVVFGNVCIYIYIHWMAVCTLQLHIDCWNFFFLCRADLECKRRWTGLREKYRREKILNYKQRRLGQVVDITQRWRNYMNMMFLDQVYTPRGYSFVLYSHFTNAFRIVQCSVYNRVCLMLLTGCHINRSNVRMRPPWACSIRSVFVRFFFVLLDIFIEIVAVFTKSLIVWFFFFFPYAFWNAEIIKNRMVQRPLKNVMILSRKI